LCSRGEYLRDVGCCAAGVCVKCPHISRYAFVGCTRFRAGCGRLRSHGKARLFRGRGLTTRRMCFRSRAVWSFPYRLAVWQQ
jgi:hypothetical protein